MGGGRGPQAVTFTLQVELDQLDETSQQEIREQLNTLLLSVGARDVTFNDFLEGSTIVTAISKKSFSVDTLKEKITKMDEVQTIQYTVKDSDPKVKKTTVFSKVDDEELIYSNDLILVDTNNNTEYTDVGVDGVITRAIVDAAVDRTTIQCVICGGNARTIADYDSKKAEDTTVFGLITTLTTVNLGQVEKIGGGAFGGCTSLTTLDFKQVQTIGDVAFGGCTSLTTLDFKQVQTIGDVAFTVCESLTTLDFKQVQTIGANAFSGCDSLTTLDFGQVNDIGGGAFISCTSLTTLDFKQVQTIGDVAFGLCESLTDIDFKQVHTIGVSAFAVCESLTTLDFKQVQTIGVTAFSGCDSLTTLDFGQVNDIGGGAFFNCTKLREVRLKVAQAWTIPAGCFLSCLVVDDGTEANPFLVANTIPSITFEDNNGVFSGKSVLTPPGGLELEDYDDDPRYKRVKVV